MSPRCSTGITGRPPQHWRAKEVWLEPDGASELCDAGCVSVFVDAADLAAHLASALDAARSTPAAAGR